ncbi:LysM peptidoglycan-binding domain-containing protein [Quadrisphaera sp. INWT6]|uniref:LysM peptidoglycan-binding domain-containing protein n=1 Tax=Quadrisphaera sp. INWT6 TaxID=2596917 RepID=UPI0018927796|nr:LysM peptidoglycan-binding domain-containing protein [Quadrisphaera sp. INWT6]MBF5082404.1 LysM peptidoglycan-binding domain-containing protein [Quadrisphaera sp. INWT6]
MTTTPVRPRRIAELERKRSRADVAVDVARGLTSLVVLVAVVVGAPVLLLIVGWPLVPDWLSSARGPSEVVELLLGRPDDGSLLLGVMTAVAWSAWASFVVALAMEVLAALTGRLPRRLPLLAPQQRIAGGLVSAVVVMATAPLAVAAPPAAITTAAETVSATAAPAALPETPDIVVVRSGDTLWSIAQAETGNGADYLSIARATSDVVQPDGRKLRDPDLIYPGWTVVVPQQTQTAPPPPPTPPASMAPSAEPTASATPSRSSTAHEPGSAPSAEVSTPSVAPAPASTTPPALPRPTSSGEDRDEEHEVVEVALTVGVGVLTAAGLLALIRRRRARQQRRRRAGQRLPAPPTPVKQVQRNLSAIQAPATSADLDSALRHLARECRERGVPLPAIQLVRLVSDHVELHLTTPSGPVSPFTAAGSEDTTWTATTDALRAVKQPTGDDEPAPYPTLVALGADLDGAEVLLDLEAAGDLVIRFKDPSSLDVDAGVSVDAVAAALVVEMATTPWGEEMDVVVVDDDPVLVRALDVDRMRWSGDAAQVEAELRVWASAVCAASPGQSGREARALDARSDTSMRELLRPRVVVVREDGGPAAASLLACSVELREENRVLPLTVVQLAHSLHRTDGSPGAFDLTLATESGRARLDPVGLVVRPHHLDAQTRQHAVEALQHASAPPEHPVAATAVTAGPTSVDVVTAGVGDLSPVTVPSQRASAPAPPSPNPAGQQTEPTAQHPVIAVLGPVEVNHARGEVAEQRHVASMLEALAYMALHPQRERFAFDQALWPHERVPDARRQQLVSRARRWLGTDEAGAPYVLLVNPDGYRLADTVTTDWQEFQRLVPSPSTAPTDDLERALRLVRGQPFSGSNPRRYGWADDDAQEMIAAIVDVAHELATRAQHEGDGPRARRAALKGLLVEPSSEMLWRDALGAEFLSGNRAGLEALTERFLAVARDLGDDLEPETEALLRELFSRLPNLDPAHDGARRAT